MAAGTIGRRQVPREKPRSSSYIHDTTASPDARPCTEPPDRHMASILSIMQVGSSKSVSRVPGAAPRTSPEAVAPFSGKITVTPLRALSSWALPTVIPSTSVIKFRGPGLIITATDQRLSIRSNDNHQNRDYYDYLNRSFWRATTVGKLNTPYIANCF